MQTIIVESVQLWSNKNYATLICFSHEIKKKLAGLYVIGTGMFIYCQWLVGILVQLEGTQRPLCASY